MNLANFTLKCNDGQRYNPDPNIGHVRADDVTYVLTGQSYWPSYNTPFFEEIFNLSGSPANVEKYGDWFTYDKTPRALIFERDHFKVPATFIDKSY